jgi:thiol-disulfide isomerase/thioredoxin
MFNTLLASLGDTLRVYGPRLFAATQRLFAGARRCLRSVSWLPLVGGSAALVAVLALALGEDSLARAQPASMTSVLQSYVGGTASLPVEGVLPPLNGEDGWLNSAPLTPQALHGKVVLIDFWTYSCINCLRTLPYIKAWAQKYQDQGLVVIGVHAPEFAFERNIDNVKRATRDLKIDYPVALDNHFAFWRAMNNQYWPALYFVDEQGRIRHHQFGEGGYAESEKVIQQLLAEAGHADAQGVTPGADAAHAPGVERAADEHDVESSETYIGYAQADNFASPGGEVRDATHSYTPPSNLSVNDWGLAGAWAVGPEYATVTASAASIAYRFHARDLHLVLGPGATGRPVRFRVTIDGAAPGDAHGSDTDAQGNGVVNEQKLYQLVRQSGAVHDHTFAIRFLDPGAQAYVFTFG